MSKREQARAEAAFMRGDTGVDGAATEEKQDEAEVERMFQRLKTVGHLDPKSSDEK